MVHWSNLTDKTFPTYMYYIYRALETVLFLTQMNTGFSWIVNGKTYFELLQM